MRLTLALVCATVLAVGASRAQEKKPSPSVADDLQRLIDARWLNEMPGASWNKLADEQKKRLGGKAWKKVELVIVKLSAPDDGRTHSLTPSFFRPGEEKSAFGITTYFHVREEKGKRFIVLTNLDKAEYKVEYAFHGDKLRLRGTYLHRELSSGVVFIPEVFDGEYVPAPLGKK